VARDTDAVCRLCRRQGEKLFLKGERCFTPKCAVERHNTPPGQSSGMRRRKVSERGLQLREKQRARWMYGVLEKQFRRHFGEAERRPGITGENLLRILETRLDNVVYRLGFADSRAQARQLVNHGHFTLNGRKTDIPSARVKPGDVVAVREKSRKNGYFDALGPELARRTVPPWLTLDAEQLLGRLTRLPDRPDIDTKVNEQIIVEYYSR
jgi:small subunit ribosomal protein S4